MSMEIPEQSMRKTQSHLLKAPNITVNPFMLRPGMKKVDGFKMEMELNCGMIRVFIKDNLYMVIEKEREL